MAQRIALATSAAFPDLDEDGPALIAALAELGAGAVPAIWDDAGVDWSSFDAVVVRSTWDYTRRREEFLAWARRMPRLLNDAGTLGWNTDKSYLRFLAASGVPIVPTSFIDPGLAPSEVELDPSWDQVVVKPNVSADAADTARFAADDPAWRSLADRIQASGRVVLIQPYLPLIEASGETSLIYLGGSYSHAIRKSPLLRSYGETDRPYPAIASREPSEAERALGERTLAALKHCRGALDRPPVYARVDMAPGPSGEPVLMELELTEPSLYLSYDASGRAAARFAAAILSALD